MEASAGREGAAQRGGEGRDNVISQEECQWQAELWGLKRVVKILSESSEDTE